MLCQFDKKNTHNPKLIRIQQFLFQILSFFIVLLKFVMDLCGFLKQMSICQPCIIMAILLSHITFTYQYIFTTCKFRLDETVLDFFWKTKLRFCVRGFYEQYSYLQTNAVVQVVPQYDSLFLSTIRHAFS